MARKLSMPKGSPSIDMTPMVDLAFLLVTFFMLAAKTRTSEPIDVKYSSSISDEEVPTKTLVMMTVDKGGRIFLNPGPAAIRKNLLLQMGKDYKVSFTKDQVEEFESMTSFGCTMSQLPAYLDMEDNERKAFETLGVPSDTTASRNELKDWLYYSNLALKKHGEELYKKAVQEQRPGTPDPLPEGYKPKFVIRADGEAAYANANRVVETCRDLKFNNLNFVPSLEMNR